MSGQGKQAEKILLKTPAGAAKPPRVCVFCACNLLHMERLLSLLFSITLLMATAPPKSATNDCSYSGGICVQKESCDSSASDSACSLGHQEDKSENSACPMPICCVCGPCCCLCIVPERPVLPTAIFPDETGAKIFALQNFSPQQVWLSVWKPPAFSV
jgi:hypothetical protein